MIFRPHYKLLAFSSKLRNATCVSFSGGGSHLTIITISELQTNTSSAPFVDFI